MLGHKVREFEPLTAIYLEDLVPANNFYRQVEKRIDLHFVLELAAEFYSTLGRISIDPVVFFKLQLITLLMRACTVSVETIRMVKEML